jgi:hypothetical protein
VLLAVISLALLTACADSGTLKIAVFLPNDAESARQGMELALREIDAREGMRMLVRFFPYMGATEASENIKEFSPAAMLAFGRGIAGSIAPLAEEKALPLIGLSVPDDGFTEGKRWIFRNSITYAEEHRALTALFRFLNLRRICAAGSAEDEFIAGFEEKFRAENIEMFHAPAISDAVSATPDAILLVDAPESLSNTIYRCRELGYTGKIIARALSPAQQCSTPVYGIALHQIHAGLSGRVFDIFQTQYEKEMTPDAALAYDAIIMLSKILVSDTIHPETVRAALDAEFVYPSFLGIRSSPAGEHDFVPRLFPVLLDPARGLEYLEEELDDALLLR